MAELHAVAANQDFLADEMEDDVFMGVEEDEGEGADGPGEEEAPIQPVGEELLQMFAALPEAEKKEAMLQLLESWLHGLPDPTPKADDIDFTNAMMGTEKAEDCLQDGPSFYQSQSRSVIAIPAQTNPYVPADYEYAEPPDVYRQDPERRKLQSSQSVKSYCRCLQHSQKLRKKRQCSSSWRAGSMDYLIRRPRRMILILQMPWWARRRPRTAYRMGQVSINPSPGV